LREQPRRPTINIIPRHDPLARVHQSRDAHQRRHPRRKRKRPVRALQIRHLFLQLRSRRVPTARIIVRPVLSRARLRERGRLIQRRRRGPVRVRHARLRVRELRRDLIILRISRRGRVAVRSGARDDPSSRLLASIARARDPSRASSSPSRRRRVARPRPNRRRLAAARFGARARVAPRDRARRRRRRRRREHADGAASRCRDRGRRAR